MRKMREKMNAKTSATVIAHHIPSTPRNKGNISTDEVWNISVLINDISAETAPLLSAVKNDEVKILKPANRNEYAKSLNACFVRL